jgi:hypothetical protein
MIEGDDPSHRFLPRIRQELDKLPLTTDQRDKIARSLLENVAFLDSQGKPGQSGYLSEDSSFFDFESKVRAFVSAFEDEGLLYSDYLRMLASVPKLLGFSPDRLISNVNKVVNGLSNEGLTRREFLKAAMRWPSVLQAPDTVLENVRGIVTRFADSGLTTQDYVKAALVHPSVFCTPPETAERNIRESADRLGMPVTAYLKAAMQNSTLFYTRPETIEHNVRTVADVLSADGFTTDTYINAALKSPALFWLTPAQCNRNIEGMVDLFTADGLTTDHYLRAIRKRPILLTYSPETLADNIIGLVERFKAEGLSVPQYLQAVLKQHSLFPVLPQTVADHITGVVERYEADGLTTRAYLDAALRQPILFTMSPETVCRHIDTVLDFAARGIFRPPAPRRGNQRVGPSQNPSRAAVIDFLLKHPGLMALADENFGVREVHQRLTDGPTDARLLTRPRYAVEQELMAHLGHDDPSQPVETDGFVAGSAPPTEEQAKRFLLRALMHAGYIKGGSMER